MKGPYRILALCCFATIVALFVVGTVSHGVIRHIVQTCPIWIPILLAIHESDLCKWAAMPCFIFWLLVMAAIGLFLLGWARIVTGTFSPLEIAMVIIVGLASLLGMVKALRMRTKVPSWAAATIMIGIAMLQLAAFRVSLLPSIAHR